MNNKSALDFLLDAAIAVVVYIFGCMLYFTFYFSIRYGYSSIASVLDIQTLIVAFSVGKIPILLLMSVLFALSVILSKLLIRSKVAALIGWILIVFLVLVEVLLFSFWPSVSVFLKKTSFAPIPVYSYVLFFLVMFSCLLFTGSSIKAFVGQNRRLVISLIGVLSIFIFPILAAELSGKEEAINQQSMRVIYTDGHSENMVVLQYNEKSFVGIKEKKVVVVSPELIRKITQY